MSNVVSLTRVLIKNNVLAFAGRKKSGKQVSTKGSAIGFLSIILFCVLIMSIPIIYALNDLLKLYDVSEVLISITVSLGGLTTIIFGIFSIISIFYFSKDNEQLLPLPIKSSELLFAKFFASLISEYLILLLFVFPIIFGIGIGSGASLIYYLYATGICILMPIIPSVIISIILMLANKIFNFGKRKDIFMYIMTGFILIFSFAYSFGLQYILDIAGEQGSSSLLSGNFENIISLSKWLFPFFNSAIYSLVHCNEFIGLVSFISFIGINLIFLTILYFVGDKLYIKGITKNGGNNKNKNKSLTRIYKEDKGGVLTQLIKKEWITIKRTPVFMLNIVIINFIFPLIIIISLLFSFSGEGIELSMLRDYIDLNNCGILFIVIGILMFLCSMSGSTSSAISREGSNAWMMKTMPVSLKKQLDAKVYFSLIIDFVILLIIEIPVIFILKVPFYYALLVNIPLVLSLLIVNYIALLLDLIKPRLDWKEENEAVKQNFNVFLGMLVSMLFTAIFVMLGISLIDINTNIYLIFIITSMILFVVYVTINILIKKNILKLFSKVG